MKILFVCTGNTCRSPMAEALFNREMSRRFPGRGITAASAGLMAYAGMPASGGAQAVMADAGILLSDHRARPVDRAMVDEADLILTMTTAHAEQLKRRFPDAAGKCFAYADYLNRAAGTGSGKPFAEVADPFGGDADVYRACAGQLLAMTGALAGILAENTDSDTGSDTGSNVASGAVSEAGSDAGPDDSAARPV